MLDYKNGKIYTIRHKQDSSLVYVGSTCQDLYKRFYQHKLAFKNPNCEIYGIKLYTKMREDDYIDNWYIELHSYYACNNKEELIKREGEVMREISTLNTIIGEKQYIRKQTKIIEDNKKQQWKIKNRPLVLEYHKEYNECNKQKIKEIGEQRVTCDCGLVCRKDQIPRHSRTNTHTKRLKEMTQEEKDKTKEIQEKEKSTIRITKETPIEVDKQMLDKIVDKLHVMDTEQLAKILIEARKTRLLD